MFIRAAILALIGSAITLVNGQNVGDGMFPLLFF
jgi:hypothetical protein